ncbi:MAG: alpha/beta fold hydrolase [Burkholderiaceae bacterium]
MLMVPPCINKFYIMDLQPENSLVAYLVGEGHTVFMVSWRNVKADQGHLTWDDYLETGIVDAIEVAREITGQEQINALGFCVGGTIIATTLAALAARGEHPVASLTLLTTLLDFEEPGILNIFIDEAQVAWREATLGKGGLMAGAELAHTFSALRPNDLIWNYVVSNYLKGEAPPAFDLLYWNGDSTNCPGRCTPGTCATCTCKTIWSSPGTLTCLGQPIDLTAIDVPTFVYGSREDHGIVPWRSAYVGARAVWRPALRARGERPRLPV